MTENQVAFLKSNLGYIITIVVTIITASISYGVLMSRVSTLETTVQSLNKTNIKLIDTIRNEVNIALDNHKQVESMQFQLVEQEISDMGARIGYRGRPKVSMSLYNNMIYASSYDKSKLSNVK